MSSTLNNEAEGVEDSLHEAQCAAIAALNTLDMYRQLMYRGLVTQFSWYR